jgi:hypothetical protein
VIRINTYTSKVAQKVRHTIDNPFVTIRVLQITTIVTLLSQKTYYSLTLVAWSFILGTTLNMRVCWIATVVLAIPSMFLNLVTFQYANIAFTSNPL